MEWWAEIKAACRNDRQLAVLLGELLTHKDHVFRCPPG